MTGDNQVLLTLPNTPRKDFMVLESASQKESLYHTLRREILRALNQGFEDFETETKKTEKTLEDGTIVSEEVTTKKPSQRYWMSVHEILSVINENKPKLEISNFNCYYHLKKLLEQGLVEQHPPPKKGVKGSGKRVRGMFFRTSARFFVPTTFEISTDLAERDVLPPEVTEKAVMLAQQVKETGRADAYEYKLKIGRTTYWFSVTMSLHDDGESIVSVVRDISSQKKNQEALRLSLERLDLALRGADLAPWDWHHKTGTMTFSDRYADMLGYTLDELNSFSDKWEELIHPDDLEMALSKWDEHIDGNTQMYSSEHRIVNKKGQNIWVLDRGRIVEWDEKGAPLRAAGTLLDVTPEKLVLEALGQSEERYLRLINESLQGIAIFNQERIIFANPAYAKTVGYSIGDLLGMSTEETWNMIHPGNKEVASGKKKLPRVRFRYVRPDNNVRWVDSYVNVVEHDGQQAMQALEVDITEQHEIEEALRESEKRFRGIFEVSPFGILLFNTDGNIVELNEVAKQILGISKPSDYKSYRLDKDPNIPDWVLRDVQEGSLASFESQYDLKKAGFKSSKSGVIHLQVTGIVPYVSEDGTILSYIAHISEVKELNDSSR
ncbi:MAG: PAS domain S-box protein [Candidatus Thorarchaeota archaeon]|jgi:PAS domain S-box-containing protein